MEIQSIADLRYWNKTSGQFWFSPDTMRFFKTRILGHLQYGNDKRAFFLTSDKAGFSEEAGREFKIRVANKQTADVRTFGEAYKSKAEAVRVMKETVKQDGEEWMREQKALGR